MTNIILPLVSVLLTTIGKTIDLRNYDTSRLYKPIYDLSDVVETQVNTLNSSYYVLPDGNIPYSKFSIPIDVVLGIRTQTYSKDMLGLQFDQNLETVTILVVGEYRTIDRSAKENASPLPNWQNSVGKKDTHYIDRIMYGSRVVGQINIRTDVIGDIQIIRRILRDVMGSSGRVEESTVDLWRKAYKTITESPDIRGMVSVQLSTSTSRVKNPSNIHNNVENLLKLVAELPTQTMPPPTKDQNVIPLYASFKPLHDLDERYPSLQKNEKSEQNLVKLDAFERDVDYAYSNLRYFPDYFEDEKVEEEFQDFYRKLNSVRGPLRRLMYNSSLNLYTDLNLPAFESAFQKYQEALDDDTENFFMDFNKKLEEIGATCERNFLKPVRGSLKVATTEAIKKGKVDDLEECQDLCFDDERCRAVGYVEEDKECVIFYRSTNLATILFPEDGSGDVKTYDRKCR